MTHEIIRSVKASISLLEAIKEAPYACQRAILEYTDLNLPTVSCLTPALRRFIQ